MRKSIVYTLIACLLVSSLPFSVTADATEDIPTNAAATGVHDSLVAALTQANLVATLQGTGPFTVFAPTDQAFADAGIDLATFDTDEENATLVDILTYHVVSGKVMSSDLTDRASADAINGDKLAFTVGSEVKVNGATVTGADVETSNGVIHVIDKVLMPPVDVYVSDGSMTSPYYQFFTDSAATNAMSEIDITKNYKFQRVNNPSTHPFYISDSGYATEASAELLIAGDGSITEGISNNESFTVFFRDGFTVEDTLSYFCTVHSSMFADFTLTTSAVPGDIPTVASSTGIHTALVAALSQANLVATLEGDGPFTVFAPTDEAFTAAGINLSTFDTDEEIATLADILTYHVVSGKVMSSDLTDGMTATAVNTDSLTFTVNADGVMVNDATVILADVNASNGVIHVIDKVLMPPADAAPDPFEGVDCAVTIRLTADGYGFTPSIANIENGETVCWSWTDAAMAHNVKQVDGFQSTTYVANGVTSGTEATTVAFHHTFTENQTFYYACEPHISMNMFGEVVVGDGGVEPKSDDDDENTPGFMASTMILAALGAILFMGRRRSL